MHSTAYDFLRDQGSLIAGLLALFAGVVAYLGARKGAAMQVTALKEQTATLREQNAYLTRENQRKLARDSLVSIRSVAGSLEKIKDDVKDLNKRLKDPRYFNAGQIPTVTLNDIGVLSKPEIRMIWDNLGSCGQDVVEKFLMLDKKIGIITKCDNLNINYIRNNLGEIGTIIKYLDDELDSEARRCNSVLQD